MDMEQAMSSWESDMEQPSMSNLGLDMAPAMSNWQLDTAKHGWHHVQLLGY